MRVTNAALDQVFNALADGRISRQTEYWPDSYDVPEWRTGLVEINPEIARW
ncbi:MAG: hypothetical protein Q4G36_04695 [Paracoccus sp. (in: a-proteobacteria)]|nr:hypothetical protein [Paracoccus sp. (in: a-proteobacteria)]